MPKLHAPATGETTMADVFDVIDALKRALLELTARLEQRGLLSDTPRPALTALKGGPDDG